MGGGRVQDGGTAPPTSLVVVGGRTAEALLFQSRTGKQEVAAVYEDLGLFRASTLVSRSVICGADGHTR